MALKLTEQPDGVRLSLKVVPGASRDRIIGEYGEALKVVVSKPPEGGAANKAVITLLAEALGVAIGAIAIVRGQTNRRKDVLIAGLSINVVRERLEPTRGSMRRDRASLTPPQTRVERRAVARPPSRPRVH
jgi:uncharacterized protein